MALASSPFHDIAVIGCGGIGGIIAASLTRGGHAVTPITGNPAISEALKTRGYRVRDLGGDEWSVAASRPPLIRASDDPGRHDPDVVKHRLYSAPASRPPTNTSHGHWLDGWFNESATSRKSHIAEWCAET